MPKSTLRHGEGGEAYVLTTKVRPSKVVQEALVNISAMDTLERCTMLRQEMRQRNGADIKCIVFTHPSIGNGEQELWAAKRYVHTSKEGLPDKFLEDLPVAPTAPEPEAEALPEAVVDAVG